MDTHIYHKLLSIVPLWGYIERSLIVNVEEHDATLEDTLVDIPCVDGSVLTKLNNINQHEASDMDPRGYDAIIKQIIKVLDTNKPNEIRTSFFQWSLARDEVLKNFKQYRIPKIKNPETQNIEYYGNYLSQKDMSSFIFSTQSLCEVFKRFKEEKHKKVMELHHITKVLHQISGQSDVFTRMDYISMMGFKYIYNTDEYLEIPDPTNIMYPLPEINIDYAKKKIHILEIELAYLNRNIKALKKGIRSRLEEDKRSK